MAITPDLAREVFHYDPETGVIRWRERDRLAFKNDHGWRIHLARYAGKVAGSVDAKGYTKVSYQGHGIRAHRLAWMIVHGETPLGEIDHINGDRSDNRIENLRVVKSWENARNTRLADRNTSGVPGVSFRPDLGRWSASIGVGAGKKKALGFFDTMNEAVAARRAAEIVLEYHPNHGRRTAS